MQFANETTTERIGLARIRQRLRPLSPYGKIIKQRMPFYGPGCEDQVRGEWKLISALLEAWEQGPQHVQDIELSLHSLRDVRGIVKKAFHGYVLEDIELFEVKRFLELTAKINSLLQDFAWLPKHLKLPGTLDLQRVLRAGEGAGFYLDDNFAPGLARLREELRNLKVMLATLRKERQEQISRETGKDFNHQGRLRVSKLEGELIRDLAECPQLILAGETYTEVEYMLRDDQEMAELGRSVYQLEEKIQAQEHAVRQNLSNQVAGACRRLLPACRRLGRLDLLIAKARLARETGWCVPELVAGPCLELEDFANPVVSEYLTEQNQSFQVISLCMNSNRVTVITGANMGGKSVTLKSVGLAVAMAQLGLLVPAKALRFSLRSFVFYSQQNEDPGQGLSTFGAEIHSLAEVLPLREELGLFLLDEPARGTNPWEGGALVKAIAKWLTKGNSLTLIATHFPGLSNLVGVGHLQVAGLLDFSPGDYDNLKQGLESLNRMMDYSLVPGKGEVPRDALKIAGFLGLSKEILTMASQEMGLKE